MSSSSTALRELQRDLENKANDLSKLQKGKPNETHAQPSYIAKNHQVKKKYTIQLGENELVLKELDLLNEDANVYKLIGPVLVKQDLAEANANVRKRIEYISAELKRLDASLQDLEEKQYSKREAVYIKGAAEDSISSSRKSKGITHLHMFVHGSFHSSGMLLNAVYHGHVSRRSFDLVF
ncbi:hypothetical protein SCA6_019924 [Theobroma cacao]